MSASKQAKQMGFKSLAEVADLFHCSVLTLQRWYNAQPDKFEVVLLGLAIVRATKNNDSKRK